MAKAQKQWAIRARAALREVLGGVCKRCGAGEPLEFDCIAPMGDRHHKLDSARRISFYRMQHRLGNVQLLCPDCHSLKTAADLLAAEPITVPESFEDIPY